VTLPLNKGLYTYLSCDEGKLAKSGHKEVGGTKVNTLSLLRTIAFEFSCLFLAPLSAHSGGQDSNG